MALPLICLQSADLTRRCIDLFSFERRKLCYCSSECIKRIKINLAFTKPGKRKYIFRKHQAWSNNTEHHPTSLNIINITEPIFFFFIIIITSPNRELKHKNRCEPLGTYPSGLRSATATCQELQLLRQEAQQLRNECREQLALGAQHAKENLGRWNLGRFTLIHYDSLIP